MSDWRNKGFFFPFNSGLSGLSDPAAAVFDDPLFHLKWITSLYLACLIVTAHLPVRLILSAEWKFFKRGGPPLCRSQDGFSAEITDNATVIMRAIQFEVVKKLWSQAGAAQPGESLRVWITSGLKQ